MPFIARILILLLVSLTLFDMPVMAQDTGSGELVIASAEAEAGDESGAVDESGTSSDGIQDSFIYKLVEKGLEHVVGFLAAILFFDVLPGENALPFIIFWLIAAGVFFTIKMGLVNFRLFGHAITVIRGKYSRPDDPGEVSHFQALSAAVSATVGLGNIAGVAVAVSTGGPGAVIWMVIAGLLGMSTKFVEVTLGSKYRKFDKKGNVSGGAFHYLKDGLAEMNMPRLGKALAIIFAVFCIFGSFGGGNMFQSNQTVTILTDTFSNGNETLKQFDWVIALLLAVAVGTVLIGGIKRIALVAEAIVPLMAFIYIFAAIVVLTVHYDALGESIAFMFRDAFTGEAVGGGILGALIAGFRRAAFSNEAGLGSAPIAHSAAKTSQPVREGCVALLEPFIDTVVICFITGLVITVTGVYTDKEATGVMLSSQAFATVIDWFPIILSIAVTLFAYSTMITWSYYGEKSWEFLFGRKTITFYHVLFVTATFIGGIMSFGIVLDLSDLLILAMAIPNIFGLYLLSGKVKDELRNYVHTLKEGGFDLIEEGADI